MVHGFCEKCAGNCCTDFVVYVTHADIKRLKQFTKKVPERFVVPYLDDGRTPYPLVDLDDYGPNLRLGLIRNDDKCVFMDTLNSQIRCTVHSHKPMVCRTYPFSFIESGELIHVEPYKCPKPILPVSPEEREQILLEINQLFNEFDGYEKLTKEWNSSLSNEKREFEILLNFLLQKGQK